MAKEGDEAAGSVNKKLLAFLNGLARRKFLGEEITDEMLRDQVLGGIGEEEYATLVNKYDRLISSIVVTDMDFDQLDSFLQLQMKKKDGGVTANEAATLAKFWRLQKAKIHEAMVSRTAWDNELKSFSWRIDACSRARHVPQLSNMSAIVEMQLGPHGKPVSDVVHFELSEEDVKKLLSQVEDIERAIAEHST